MDNKTLIPGTDNYRIQNCPVILPKENLPMFTAMSQAGATSPYCTQTFANQYTHPTQKSTQAKK